jgi:hypothetical protein
MGGARGGRLTPFKIFCIIITASQKNGTKVNMQTSMGEIQLELYDDKSPETMKNYLAYVDSGFYEGTIFHRVIPDFVIQGYDPLSAFPVGYFPVIFA